MSKKIVGLATAAMAGLFVLSTGVEPVLARDGGGGGGRGGGGGGGGSHSYSGGGGGGGGRSISGGGGRSMSGNRSSNGPRVSGNRDGSRVYGYQARGHNRGHNRGHGHRGRGGVVVYGYSDYGYYNATCAYEYERAVATGSSYWWNRYQECID